MKNVIRYIIVFIFALTGFSGIVFAQSIEREFVGKTCPTDIVTYIDGMEIPSYNVNGRMYVLTDDLMHYGFEINFSSEDEFLDIDTKTDQKEINPIPQPQPRLRDSQDVYCVKNIRVYYNGISGGAGPCYEIDGKIAIRVRSIDELEDSYQRRKPLIVEEESGREIVYNAHFLALEWHPENRTVRIDALRQGDKVKTAFGTAYFEYFEEWFRHTEGSQRLAENDDTNMFYMLYDSDPAYVKNRYYPAVALFQAMGIEYDLTDSALSVCIPPDNPHELMVYTKKSEIDLAKQMLDPLPMVRIYKKSNPEDSVLAMIYYDGELFINALDLEKIADIHCEYDEETENVKFVW